MARTTPRLRSTFAAAAALAAALGGVTAITPMAHAATATPAAATPLSPELEAVRAAEATKIYGDPAIRPWPTARPG